MKPEDRADEFLAAPDSLRRSEVELKKAKLRKAQQDAEEKRLRASKSDDVPSVEDLLADLVRVAEDPSTNPFWKFKAISRKRYRLYGWFPLEFIDKEFGQFNHALEVAGLREQPGTRLKRAARAQASRMEHAARYVERHVRPYVLKNPDLTREPTGARLVLSISDTHSTFLCPFTWQCFLQAIVDLRPDVVYLNGDILEGAEISRYPKIPGWTIDLQLEFDFAREMLRQVREVGFEGDLVWGAGNHGLDRLAMYLTQTARGLSGLRTMRFDVLANLDGLDVQLAQGGTISSPEGTEDDKAGLLLYGFYRIHHGTRLGQNPAIAELKDAGRSGQSGHVHRSQLIYGTNEVNQGMSWMCTPCGCTERAARAYVKGTTTGWQKGFGVCFLYPDGDVHQYPVITDKDRCTVEGYIYERRADLPDPDPSKLWIVDLPRLT